MRFLLSCFFLFVGYTSLCQKVIPLSDFNNYFKSFENGFFRQIEFQRIEEFKAGDNVVGYIDNRGNLRVYDGGKPMDLANMEVEYTVSDNLLTWKIGRTLNMWDNGHKQTLTYDARSYWVMDSIIVYEDLRYNSVKVYYNGEITTLYTSVGDLIPPDFVGENIVAFRDNGNFYKVFWQGKVYDLDVWHRPIKFEGGTDILAFNDPINGTFAIFEKGAFLDVEEFFMDSYKAGRGFVAYENRNGDLMYYSDEKITQISNFAANTWEVKDDVVLWVENNFTYVYMNGQKIEIARFVPEDYLIKNNTVVFRNVMGGVSAIVDGKLHEITNQMNSEYEIYGNSVLVRLFNNSFIVLSKGRKYHL